jgi:hypothetical protein
MQTLPCIPAKAGTQIFGRTDLSVFASTAIPSACASQKHWVPAFAGMLGNESQGLTA